MSEYMIALSEYLDRRGARFQKGSQKVQGLAGVSLRRAAILFSREAN
jgi:hypothetical protein